MPTSPAMTTSAIVPWRPALPRGENERSATDVIGYATPNPTAANAAAAMPVRVGPNLRVMAASPGSP